MVTHTHTPTPMEVNHWVFLQGAASRKALGTERTVFKEPLVWLKHTQGCTEETRRSRGWSQCGWGLRTRSQGRAPGAPTAGPGSLCCFPTAPASTCLPDQPLGLSNSHCRGEAASMQRVPDRSGQRPRPAVQRRMVIKGRGTRSKLCL